ncbi:hypothetical protein H8711_08725 [Clostridiaceae bacterium NSJ-31]|uniref:Uncharacterized protein n=1 Tax=Ligaoa zhengdingensis TaxID=2763658 RepID=A0A926E0P1_9FIRM|nr:hypothetical protein [Ligaoa zhengdingensis]MBC8547014.1 hypothetical protein [Ligaoa zhengdingensis]
MNEEWSNNACRGYVIKAMKNCGFSAKDIHQVLVELYEVLTSALWRRRRTITKTGSPDLGPTWPEAWSGTKGQHSLPGAVLSLFPTGTMWENAGSQPTTQRRL